MLVALLVLALLFSAGSMEAGATETVAADGYTTRSPINIAHDDEFTVENGVVGGSGTATDPYRISGWHITPEWGQSTTSDRGIRIGGAVRHSHFIVEDNLIELVQNHTKGVSISSPVGGVVRGNVIEATGANTFSFVLATGVDDRQDPTQPLLIEGNTVSGQRGMGQTGVGYSGTSARVVGNQFANLDVGVNVAGAHTTGPQFIGIAQNDFVAVDWAIPALAFHGGTGSVPAIDARDNYYGHPEGPTLAMCTNTLGSCHTGPLGEKGAKVAPNVVAYPYAEEPFFPGE